MVQSGGSLTPGAVRNVGSELQLNGGLSLASGAEVTFNLFGAAAHDRVVIGPAATLDVNVASVLKVVLQGAPSFMQSFDLLDWATLTGDTDLVDNLGHQHLQHRRRHHRCPRTLSRPVIADRFDGAWMSPVPQHTLSGWVNLETSLDSRMRTAEWFLILLSVAFPLVDGFSLAAWIWLIRRRR